MDLLIRGRTTRDDRLECDLLEMIFAAPQAFPFVRQHLSKDDEGGWLEPHEAAQVLRHPALRLLLEQCLNIYIARGEVTFQQVMNSLDDSAMKRLIVWLDERARSTGLAHKIHDQGVDPVDDCPFLLKQSLENLGWRQAEQSHQRVAMQLSHHGDGPQGLDPAMEALLRQAAEFHQRRATQRQGS